MAPLTGSRTEANLRLAFATAVQAQRRYIGISEQEEHDGCHNAAALFRAIAQSRASQAEAHLTILEPCNQQTRTVYNLRAAIMDELAVSADLYPAMARTAREEGLHEIANWFEIRAKAGRSHAHRFRRALETLLQADEVV